MDSINEWHVKDTSANPAPLGLMAFGMTTVLLNLHNAGFFPLDSMILAMGIFYGGIAQVIAGIFESREQHVWNDSLHLLRLLLAKPRSLAHSTQVRLLRRHFMWWVSDLYRACEPHE